MKTDFTDIPKDSPNTAFTTLLTCVCLGLLLITLSACGKQGKLKAPDGAHQDEYPGIYPKIKPLTCVRNGKVVTEEQLDAKKKKPQAKNNGENKKGIF